MNASASRQEPLLRSFDSLDDAVAAREALLGAGVPPDLVELREIEDEAGPTEGNFLVGNGRTTHGGPPRGVYAGPEAPYEANFAKTVARGVHLLLVYVRDASERDAVRAVLKPLACIDPVASSRGQGL
jgi:hypothetical protein